AADNGTSPIFRSFPPAADSTRTFPSWPALFGQVVAGEKLPAAAGSTRRFACTVRDNHSTGAVSSAAVNVNIRADVNPMTVSLPQGNVRRTDDPQPLVVQWNPIDVPLYTAARISLRTVDGQSTSLAAAATNSGSASVTLPAGLLVDQARV